MSPATRRRAQSKAEEQRPEGRCPGPPPAADGAANNDASRRSVRPAGPQRLGRAAPKRRSVHLAASLGSPVAVSQAPGAAKRKDPLSVTIIQRPGNAGVLKSVNGSAGARRPRVAAQTPRQGQRVPRRTTNSPCRARAAAGGDAAGAEKHSLPEVAEALPHTRSASNFRQRSGRRSEGLRRSRWAASWPVFHQALAYSFHSSPPAEGRGGYRS